jgi:hypothetical protein
VTQPRSKLIVSLLLTALLVTGRLRQVCAADPPTIDPSLVKLIDSTDSALKAADDIYGKEIARARDLLGVRLDQAKLVIVSQDQPAEIDRVRQELLAETPAPEIGEHHAETTVLGPAQQTEHMKLGPSDARAAVLAYNSDLELARRRWLDNTRAQRELAEKAFADELSRAMQSGNDAVVQIIKPRATRIVTAKQGDPTIWYREQLVPDEAGNLPKRQLPVALAARDFQIDDPQIGQQFKVAFTIRTLVAEYSVNPKIFSPGCFLLIFDGDQIIYYSGGAWGGSHTVDSDMSYHMNTHSNVLRAAKGKAFLFAKPGLYAMRIVLVSGGGWDDVLDAYQKEITVPAADVVPAP